MKLEELQNSLEAHEQRLNERNGVKIEEQALKASHKFEGGKGDNKKGKGKWRGGKNSGDGGGKSYHHQDSQHGESSNSKQGNYSHAKGDKKKFGKRKIQCYNCHKWGHFADECRSGKGGKSKSDDEAYHARDEGLDSEEILLMVTTSSNLNTSCSNHMTGHKD